MRIDILHDTQNKSGVTSLIVKLPEVGRVTTDVEALTMTTVQGKRPSTIFFTSKIMLPQTARPWLERITWSHRSQGILGDMLEAKG